VVSEGVDRLSRKVLSVRHLRSSKSIFGIAPGGVGKTGVQSFGGPNFRPRERGLEEKRDEVGRPWLLKRLRCLEEYWSFNREGNRRD